MTSESAQRLLEDLYVAWLLNIGAAHDPTVASDHLVAQDYQGLQAAAADESLGILIRLLWHVRETIEDDLDMESGVGFSRGARALWCKTADLYDILGITRRPQTHPLQEQVQGKRAFEIFRERRPFSRMSAQLAEASFWPRLAAGASIDLRKDAHVIPELVKLASAELKRELTNVSIPGLPIGGVVDATIWIGFRTEQEIRRTLSEIAPGIAHEPLAVLLRHQLKQGQRAAILTFGSEERRSARAAPKTAIEVATAPWVESDGNRRFSVVRPGDERRLQRLLLPSWTIATRDWFRERTRAASLRLITELSKLLKSTAGRQLKPEAVASSTSRLVHEHLTALDEELQSHLIHDGMPETVFPDRLIDLAIREYHPSTHNHWYDWFKRRFVQEITRMYSAAFFPIDLRVHHRYFDGPISDYPDNIVAISGPTRSGRSTLLYQRVQEHYQGAFIIVIGGRSRHQRTVLITDEEVDAIREITCTNAERFVIAIEQLELEKGMPPARTVLARLIEISDRQRGTDQKPRIHIEAVIPEPADAPFEHSYGNIRAPRVDMGSVDDQFIIKLLRRWIAEYDIIIEDELFRQLTREFSRRQERDANGCVHGVWTVGTMLERLSRYPEQIVTPWDVADILKLPQSGRMIL